MLVKPATRDFNMSNAELTQFAEELVSFMTRDAAEFAARGILQADISELEAKAAAFEAFPGDVEFKGLVTIAAELKDEVRQQLIDAIRNVTDRALIKWGVHSGHYNQFGVKDLTNLGDKELLFAARRTVRLATEYLTELTSEGLTQLMIDSVETLADSFELKINAVRDAIANRDIKSEERIILGNELYALVAKDCEVGKIIWKKVSEAKYNDYVIYKKPTGLPSKVLNLNYDSGLQRIKWEESVDADSYQLDEMRDDPAFYWVTIYRGEDLEFIHPVPPGEWLYRCRAINTSGSGTWSDTLRVEQPE